MTNEMKTKLNELLQDEDFSQKALQKTSYAELVDLLKEYDIEMTEDELRACGEEGAEILKEEGYISEDGELSPKMLEMVAGGKSSGGVALMKIGAGMMGVALLSDYLAGAAAIALVSNPVGWFFGGAALIIAGGYVIAKSRAKKRK